MAPTNTSSVIIDPVYGSRSDSEGNSEFASRFQPYDRLTGTGLRSRSKPRFNLRDHLARKKSTPQVENNLFILMKPYFPKGELRDYNTLASELSEVLGKEVSNSMFSQFETGHPDIEHIVPGLSGRSGLSDDKYSVIFFMEVDGEKYISLRRVEPTSNGEVQSNSALVCSALDGLLKLYHNVVERKNDLNVPAYANAIGGPNYHISANSFPSDIHVDDRLS